MQRDFPIFAGTKFSLRVLDADENRFSGTLVKVQADVSLSDFNIDGLVPVADLE